MGEASRPAPVARVDDDPVAQALAERVVLARYADEGWTKAEALQVLQMLGLQPSKPGARTDALGRREVTARSARRRKARTSKAADGPQTPKGSTATPLAPAPESPTERNPGLPPTKDVSDATTRSA